MICLMLHCILEFVVKLYLVYYWGANIGLPTRNFIPAGFETSSQDNHEKAKIHQLYTKNKIDHQTLLESDARFYHEPRTFTFYGIVNSN